MASELTKVQESVQKKINIILMLKLRICNFDKLCISIYLSFNFLFLKTLNAQFYRLLKDYINFLVIEYIFSKSFASKTLVWLHTNHAHTCALNTSFGTRDYFSWTLFPEEAATHRLSSPVPGED